MSTPARSTRLFGRQLLQSLRWLVLFLCLTMGLSKPVLANPPPTLTAMPAQTHTSQAVKSEVSKPTALNSTALKSTALKSTAIRSAGLKSAVMTSAPLPPAVLPPPAGWSTLSTRYFELQFPPDLRPMAEMVATWADSRLEENAEVLQVKPSRRYVARFAADDATFHAIQPGRAPDWAGGTAYPDRGLLILRTSRLPLVPGLGGMETTFTHEVVHLLIGELGSEARVPRWLHEGTARLLSGETSVDEWTLLGQAALFKRIIPLEDLDRRFPSDEGRASLAYAQSRAFLSFLTERFGAGVLGGLIREMSDGQNLNDALWATVGMGLTLLEDDWLNHFETGYTWLTVFTGGMTLWAVCGGLLVLAYRRKKRESRERRARWELEEAVLYAEEEEFDLFPPVLPVRVVPPAFVFEPSRPLAERPKPPAPPAWWPEELRPGGTPPAAPPRPAQPERSPVFQLAPPPLPPDSNGPENDEDDDDIAIPTGRDRAPDGSWLH